VNEERKEHKAPVELEAEQWFIEISADTNPSTETLQRWLQWLDASEQNRKAFGEIERVLHGVSAVASASASDNRAADVADGQVGDDYDPSIPVAQWLRQTQVNNVVALNAVREPQAEVSSMEQAAAVSGGRAVWPRLLAIAAALGLVAVGVWKHAGLEQRFGRPSAGEFSTATSEHMDLTLEDGSRVTLGADSSLVVNYDERYREVRLAEGEAFFSVQKDASRPFRVHALDGVITAVGTAFNVRTTGNRVTVAVVEGSVKVTGGDVERVIVATPAPRTSISAASARYGEQLSFVSGRDVLLRDATVTRIDPTEPARWREGWLVYRDEPLRLILKDVARYTDRQISIGEGVDESLHFTGAVFKDSVIEWIKALPEAFPVTVESEDESITVRAPGEPVLTNR